MFHYKLLELESELLAKEEARRGLTDFKPECELMLQFLENEIGTHLASKVARDWKGWLTYRRKKESLVVVRGRTFAEGGLFAQHLAGLDVNYGHDTVTEYKRGFDVSPPQDLDHLLVNFGGEEATKAFLWYGENIAPYKLIFPAEVDSDPHTELGAAIVEACTWIMTRPKDITLTKFLESIARK